ncbi:DsbA family protein [Nannocystis pusilla]|uniref:DsbA family protein n=1 Tax=Nannocystis pusilla TaxID=889268 RepID=UPI003B803E33
MRFAYKAFPLEFHGYALVAALMARSALEQGKFWSFYDRIFGQKGLDLERLQDAARAAELDLSKIQEDLEALRWGTAVQRDLRQGRRLGVTGTPAYFINGRHINGAKPLELLRSVVREELELAAKWREQGVAPDKIYAHAIADGYREVQVRRPRPGLKPDVIYPVPVDDSPQRGPATAPVTIVEFADFECGFCVRGHDTLEKLRRRYGDKIRVVFKHYPLPFHSHAFLAARAAMAAHAEGKFWEFHDRLYAEKAQFDESTLLQIAKELKLDGKKFKQRLHAADADARIVTDQDLGSTLGVRGTPAYFVNGRAVDGAVPELEFRLVIQEELERAEALLREGVPPAACTTASSRRRPRATHADRRGTEPARVCEPAAYTATRPPAADWVILPRCRTHRLRSCRACSSSRRSVAARGAWSTGRDAATSWWPSSSCAPTPAAKPRPR